MMFRREGITLMEIIVVLIIVGIAAAFVFPNFTTPTELARTTVAQNNLLAIYSAQQNYNNNYGTYCLASTAAQPACTATSANCADSLSAINCNLSMSFKDDGTYTYSCPLPGGPANTCGAARVGTPTTNLVLTLNVATNLSGVGVANPICTSANNWCAN